MVDVTQFAARVREHFEGTPYRFEDEGDEGFTVHREVVRYKMVGGSGGGRRRWRLMHGTYAYEVRWRGDGAYTLATKSRSRSTDEERSDLRDDGFRPQHAADDIKGIGDGLGLERKLDATAKVAIGVAVLGGVGGLVAVVVLLVL